MTRFRNVVALSGGVGGARLVHGLSRALTGEGESLTVIVNTGDDFEHWGLHISPDVDTVMYTLADLANEERGWGLGEETFGALEMVRRFGGDGWFALGDRDLATHITRTHALKRGDTLTQVTAQMCTGLGIAARVLPMADEWCRTMIDTRTHGTLPFQTWFVQHRAAPEVVRVWFDGAPKPAKGVLEALEKADLVVFGPSNPYVSIDPILALEGVHDAVFAKPCIACSPIVHGAAIKGPLATMIPELAHEPPTPTAIARHYTRKGPGLRAMVVERGDEDGVRGAVSAVLGAETIMKTRADSLRLARELLAFAADTL